MDKKIDSIAQPGPSKSQSASQRANLQGDQIITRIKLSLGGISSRYRIVQLQACGHPKAHRKKKQPPTNDTTNKADLQTSPQTIPT
jgi:hypothetical protein